MAYCKNCGAKLPRNAGFCQECGAKVEQQEDFKKAANQAFDNFEKSFNDSVEEVGETIRTGDDYTQRKHLTDDRSLPIYIILSLITLGIYQYYFIYKLAKDVNTACESDGQKTRGLLFYIILSFITCGFYNLYWEYKIANRIADNAPLYGIIIKETGTTVLIWELVGYVTCTIGRFIALHLIIKNSNALFNAYNQAYGL